MTGFRRITAVAVTAFTVVLALSACNSSGSDAKAGDPLKPAFTADPGLIPAFRPKQTDYAVRCKGDPVTFSLNVPAGWHGRIDGKKVDSGNHEVTVPMHANQGRQLAFGDGNGASGASYHVRCLPDDFPPFRVSGRGGPRLTLVEMKNFYGAAFDGGGAPVWWYKGTGVTEDIRFLDDGTFSFAPINGVTGRQFEVRSLNGRLIRSLVAANGLKTDLHDLQLLPNGNYMLGAHRMVSGVDTSRFGGSNNSTIDTAQIQEIRPNGSLVWKWNAYPRIGLAETGRWWEQLKTMGEPYDVDHWNSVDRRGNYVLFSFRHLDAAFRINRRTGKILWKLGGTKTPKRLRVKGDPRGKYPFGGQHDARIHPHDSVSLFDNDTDLANPDRKLQARAVEYRINRKKRTATLTHEVTDSKVGTSIGFGSARTYGKGNWLIGWGAISGNGLISGYDPDGKRIFSLTTPGGVSYRANEVNGPTPAIGRLRGAMDSMYARGK